MNCPNCAAPVPARGVACAYCGSRLDVDLQGWRHLEPQGLSETLQCPDGHGPLETLVLPGPPGSGGGEGTAAEATPPLQLGRCPQCLGLFLPLGGLDQLLDQAVAPVWSVDPQLLNQLAESPRADSAPLRYRPCPSCGELMNRNLHGKRSGVVVDSCREHGIWLDAGELRQLLEWARAGGALLDQERREEEARARQEREQAERDKLIALHGERMALEGSQRWRASAVHDNPLTMDLTELMVRLVRQLL